MREATVCGGELLAVDAAQTLAHVARLATPMGTYPHATVRTSDVLCVEFDEPWRLSPPPPPDPATPAEAASGSADGGSAAAAAQQQQEETQQGALEAARRALAADFERQLTASDGGRENGGGSSSGAEAAAEGAAAEAEAEAWDPRRAETQKYWVQRYMLFSRYDEGVRLDREG